MLVAHVTDASPTLSVAVPLNTIVLDEVGIAVEDGELITRVGGVVSGDFGVFGGAGAVWRVTTYDCDTLLTLSLAVIIIVFVPLERGIPAAPHGEDPWAMPD